MSGKAENVAALIGTLGATAIAKKAADATWKLGSKGKKPPTDPADPDLDLKEAILFAVLSGAAVSVARLVIARRFARKERHEARAEHPFGH
jgi:hypothetical protein